MAKYASQKPHGVYINVYFFQVVLQFQRDFRAPSIKGLVSDRKQNMVQRTDHDLSDAMPVYVVFFESFLFLC